MFGHDTRTSFDRGDNPGDVTAFLTFKIDQIFFVRINPIGYYYIARGLVDVDMGCVPPSFVLNELPAPNPGPGTFPDFDLGHAPDRNLGSRLVSN
ncbi:hypothetical protein EVAR_28080_1 [Eumeta japonica]|uniref:Uncharacterized protein n=1 Tax=Eumeta variegata TaxID=151549 RepID=A0A4C1WC19_EUMVA|nr:hypothetical protein EVAR_28080_1 [Eumeta japonica]